MSKRTQLIKTQEPAPRGFLLLVIIGVLAVLTVVCVGFLSYTRGEVDSVASQRDKADGLDVVHSAIDWTLANVAKDLMVTDPANPGVGPSLMDPTKPLAQTTGAGVGYHWWYRPNEMGLNNFLKTNWSAWGAPPKYMNPDTTEAPWTYLPADFFPGGAVRGRFAVQVFDPNSVININDWNEDCNPSQAQMSHMLMDAATTDLGWWTGSFEAYRKQRDVGGSFPFVGGGNSGWPMRYQEGWRGATHSSRYVWWMFYNTWNAVENVVSYDWVTNNSSWFGMGGPDWTCYHSSFQSDGVSQFIRPPTSDPTCNNCQYFNGNGGPPPVPAKNFYPVDPGPPGSPQWIYNECNHQHFTMSGFTTQSHCDPDTGRCPINVNTCYNSGEVYPVNWWDPVPSFTMEGVWNIESLRRLIKVGYFWTGTCFKNAQTQWVVKSTDNKPSSEPTVIQATISGKTYNIPIGKDPLTDDEKMKVEILKTKLAYQYQETLCRYFTGTYKRKAYGAYPSVYPTAKPMPTHCCLTTDYSAPRFNCSLTQFRQWVHDDLIAMTKNPINPGFNGGVTTPNPPFVPLPTVVTAPHVVENPPLFVLPGSNNLISGGTDPADLFYNAIQQYDCDRTDGTVSFDYLDTPEIAAGKLDARVAAACFDNMIPGKPVDAGMNLRDFGKNGPPTASSPAIPGSGGCQPYKTELDSYPDGDPIYELYKMQLARQEDVDDKYCIDPTYVPGKGYDQDGTGTTFNNTVAAKNGSSYGITNASWAGGFATINAGAPFPAGSDVIISGVNPSGYNFGAVCTAPGTFVFGTPVDPGPYIAGGSVKLKLNNPNIYGWWTDNCGLPEMVGYPIAPSYPGNQHMMCQNDHFGAAYRYDQTSTFTTLKLSTPATSDNAGNAQNVCAKGRDICIRLDPNKATWTYAADTAFKSYDSRFSMGPWIDTTLPTGPTMSGITPRTNNQIDPQQLDPLTNKPDPNNNHVPWRQMCFSPDSFSTELTTTSTTFMLIINASLVDAASVNANPTNPALHRQLFWNQWGVVVEIAPGIMTGVTNSSSANTYQVADPKIAFPRDPAANVTPPYLIPGFSTGHFPYGLNPFPSDGSSAANSAFPMYAWWYRNDMPQITKTDANGMDDLCPTLVSRNRDEKEGAGQIRTRNRWGFSYNTVLNDPPATQIAPASPAIPSIDPEYTNATFVTDWQVDMRGVPPSGDPSGRGTDIVYGLDGAGVPNQVKKRILIRSIWCLNQNLFQ